MKSKFVTTLGLAGALLAGTFTTAALAQEPVQGGQDGLAVTERHGRKWGGHKGFGKRGGHKGFGFGRAIDLTDEQKTQIRSIMQSSREANAGVRQQLAELRTQMHEVTKAAQFDEARFRQLAQQQAALTTEMKVSRARTMSTIHNTVLTAEQRAKLDEMAAKRAEKRTERKAKRAEKRAERQSL